jgi:hypothetical protein
MPLEFVKSHEPESILVRGRKHNPRRFASRHGLPPPGDAQAPSVSRPQAGEAGARRDEIVAILTAESEEFCRHTSADQVPAGIAGIRLAATIPPETRNRIGAAGFQRFAEHISCLRHGTSTHP